MTQRDGVGRTVLVGGIVAVAIGLTAAVLAPAFVGGHAEPTVRTEFLRASVQRALWNTIRIAAEVVALSAAVGLPMVALLRAATGLPRRILRATLFLPLVANPLALILSWSVLLQRNGPLVWWLESMGILAVGESLLFSEGAVVGVMTYLLFSYLVIFTEGAWAVIPAHAIPAARSLGATRVQAFLRLELPALAGGFSRGAACVFVLASGYFVTPALLGGTGQTMLGQLIVHEVSVHGESARAAAYAVPLFAATGLSVVLLFVAIRSGSNG